MINILNTLDRIGEIPAKCNDGEYRPIKVAGDFMFNPLRDEVEKETARLDYMITHSVHLSNIPATKPESEGGGHDWNKKLYALLKNDGEDDKYLYHGKWFDSPREAIDDAIAKEKNDAEK